MVADGDRSGLCSAGAMDCRVDGGEWEGLKMKIIKVGNVVQFVCNSCDCEFVVGVHAVETSDNGENYYVSCPICGADCHTDCAKFQGEKNDKKIL